MKTFEIKTLDSSVLDVDDKSRRVKVALNKVGVKDHDKDIIESTAFNKTIKERGPKGKNLIWHLTDHYTSLKHAVGKFTDLFMENDFLVGVTDVPNTTWGNDVLEFYKTGTINQHSIGFATVKREVYDDDDYNKRYCVLKEVTLYEGSAVLWGANEFTPTLSVGKSLNKEERDSEFKKTMDDLGTLHKLFKNGHLSDNSYELLEMKILQLTNKLQQIFEEITQPVVETVEPIKDDVKDVFKTFKQKLKTVDNGQERINGAA